MCMGKLWWSHYRIFRPNFTRGSQMTIWLIKIILDDKKRNLRKLAQTNEVDNEARNIYNKTSSMTMSIFKKSAKMFVQSVKPHQNPVEIFKDGPIG